MPFEFDVAIAGAGPAGSACALSLRAHAPALSVVLVEASRFDTPRLGETLSPAARPMLEHLGVFERFLRAGHPATHGTASRWGSDAVEEKDFLFFARGEGWHLDRTAFDAMLAGEASSRGVTVLTGTRELPPARFIVDATGSGTIATHRFGARFHAIDHLMSFARFFESGGQAPWPVHRTGTGGGACPPCDPRTIVESFADGWWYTAALPDQRRVVACLTDADVARELRLHELPAWSAALEAMPLVGAIAREASDGGAVIARATESRCLIPAAGENWLAVGDSASRFDPLSSQGITKALRSGIFASYAIGDLLVRGSARGLRAYDRFIRAEFDAYTAARAKVYAQEARWRDREFWRRRIASA